MSEPRIIAEGKHVRHTARGIVITGEFSRPVEATCSECSHAEPLRLVADDILDDNECDEVLTAYLEGAGWYCGPDGDDVCPTCTKARR